MPGVMQMINKAIGPAETGLAIGATIADPALAGATIPLAFQGLSSMSQQGGLLGPNPPKPPPTPNFPNFSATPSPGSFFSDIPTSASTGIVPTVPGSAGASGSPQGVSSDLINQAIANAMGGSSSNPFAMYSTAA